MGLLDTDMLYLVKVYCFVLTFRTNSENHLPEAAAVLSPETSILEGLLQVLSTCRTLSVTITQFN